MYTSITLLVALSVGMLSWGGVCAAQGYEFKGGYPTPETVQRAYDEADLNRAIQTYRFFYPTVSFMGTWEGNLDNSAVPNKVFALLEGTPPGQSTFDGSWKPGEFEEVR
jgi:hypothetical protein